MRFLLHLHFRRLILLLRRHCLMEERAAGRREPERERAGKVARHFPALVRKFRGYS
jgi:hypothetical protein